MITRSPNVGGSLAVEPVLPHYLEMYEALGVGAFSNTLLRVGEVKEVLPPDDPKNLSKKFYEYRVLVQHLDTDTLTGSAREYAHCTLLNPFAGLADRLFLKLRADTTQDEEGLGMGSKVLLLCVNGEHNSAVILGGVRDEKDKGDTYPDKDTRFYAEINGVRVVITGAGEFSFARHGPTKIDGTFEGTEPVAGMVFTNDGSVTLGVDQNADGLTDQKIVINHPSKKIEMVAENGVYIGTATDSWPLFSTYRRAEQQLHTTLISLLTSLAALNEIAATAMKATSVLHVVPIVGPILASPALGQISVQMTAMTALINASIQAINGFESGAISYLSRTNKND